MQPYGVTAHAWHCIFLISRGGCHTGAGDEADTGASHRIVRQPWGGGRGSTTSAPSLSLTNCSASPRSTRNCCKNGSPYKEQRQARITCIVMIKEVSCGPNRHAGTAVVWDTWSCSKQAYHCINGRVVEMCPQVGDESAHPSVGLPWALHMFPGRDEVFC